MVAVMVFGRGRVVLDAAAVVVVVVVDVQLLQLMFGGRGRRRVQV